MIFLSFKILIIKKRSKIKHKQDRFFSMKWYKNQVIGMSGYTGQNENKELAVEAGSLFHQNGLYLPGFYTLCILMVNAPPMQWN